MTRRATPPATAVGTNGPSSRKRAQHRRRSDQRGLGHGWSFSRSRRRAGPPSRSIGGAGPWFIGNSITISDGPLYPAPRGTPGVHSGGPPRQFGSPGVPSHHRSDRRMERPEIHARFDRGSDGWRSADAGFGHTSADAIKVKNRGSPRAGWRSDIRVGACWPPNGAWRGFSFGHSLPRLIFGSERPRGTPERPRGTPEGLNARRPERPRGTPERANARGPERPTGRSPRIRPDRETDGTSGVPRARSTCINRVASWRSVGSAGILSRP